MLWSSHLLNRCGCDTCIRDSNEDSLRHSMSRVNEYSALASPSLIALSSNDPILTAFQLSWELRNLAFTEPECRNEYMVSYLCTVEVKYFFGQKKKKKEEIYTFKSAFNFIFGTSLWKIWASTCIVFLNHLVMQLTSWKLCTNPHTE